MHSQVVYVVVNMGIMEFVEMFKAIQSKFCTKLLTATQEGNYMGTEGISAIPFNGRSSCTL